MNQGHVIVIVSVIAFTFDLIVLISGAVKILNIDRDQHE